MAAPAMGTSSYVRLRGLPFVATEQEVAQWFANAQSGPIQVHRVLFTYNTTGRKSGEAVCAWLALHASPRSAAASRLRSCALHTPHLRVGTSRSLERAPWHTNSQAPVSCRK